MKRQKQPTRKYDENEARRQNRVHGASFFKCCLLAPLLFLMRLWTRTLRFNFELPEQKKYFENAKNGHLILFWHGQLFTIVEVFKRFRTKAGVPMNGLVSPSRDGAWLATIFKLVGVKTVRGSTSRRGGQALLEMARLLDAGEDVAITPDGPRGPEHHFNQGAALLAQKSNSIVLLLAMNPRHAWHFNSWDKFGVPIPFSTIDIRAEMLPHDANWETMNTTELAHEFGEKLKNLAQ